MKSEHTFLFLDKPETLESVTFSLNKWYKPTGGDLVPDNATLSVKHGCCLGPLFEKEIEYASFKDWDSGQARLNEVLQYWTGKGFKTRKELGVIDNDVNLTHDQNVESIRRQLFELYIKSKPV